MLNHLRKFFALDNPFRLYYHKIRAIIANIIYKFPSKNMQIIWVTGTNWKTTTCNLIAKWLKIHWKKIFMFTTVNIIIWDKEFINETKMTSPDPFLLQKYLKIAKEENCEIAIIETASHWIKMHRIWWINYDICVLTNITQDHLDLHRTMKDYVNTKLEIFKKLMYYKRKAWIKKVWVLNMWSKYIEKFLEETYDSLYKYWLWAWAEIKPYNIKRDKWTTKFEIISAWTSIKIETKLKWDFNIENILAAVSVFISFWIKSEEISKMIASVSWVPGRMEDIENDLWADIIVDYAHTEDSLEKVLSSLKECSYNKIITVFWATWDRDKTKRPKMWEVVSKYSDIVVLTQDDDYTEKTENIIKDVLPWINRAEWDNFWIIPTRKEAIEVWISNLRKWDCLLVAWKWDEHTMVTNNGKIEWHDKTVIKEILKGIDYNKIVES